SRQQRAQPSHRLSHSASDISSNVLVFQKNPSWPESRLGGAVMTSGFCLESCAFPARLGDPAAAPRAGLAQRERITHLLGLSFKIAATPLVYGPRSDRSTSESPTAPGRIGFAATFPQDVSWHPAGRRSAFEPMK